jgi:hypothetical protein
MTSSHDRMASKGNRLQSKTLLAFGLGAGKLPITSPPGRLTQMSACRPPLRTPLGS